ncbi:MAG: hypothetical protein KDH88_10195 [Chromatiales bacterium]|nr:hypothetical protein [Chromatiales bacterium]
MKQQPATLGRFVVRVLIWLPAVFLVWYGLARWLNIPVAYALQTLYDEFFPGLVRDVLFLPSGLRIDSNLGGGESVAVNPLIYGYGFPMVLALTLAGFGEFSRRLFMSAVGVLLYMPVQIYGSYFDGLRKLEFDLASALGGSLFALEWKREALVLAYQIGFLILPGVTAILIWVILNADSLKVLAKKE